MTTWVHGEAATRQIAAMTARLTGHGDTSPSEQPAERWLSGSDGDRMAGVWEDSLKREWL